jgi:hypothetical protein
MAEPPPSLDRPIPEAPTLSPFELQVAILFAKGMSTKAISQQVRVASQRKVDVTLYQIDKKIGFSRDLSPGLLRRAMHDWLTKHRLLPAEGDLEAILSPTISALENWLAADGWLQPHERAGVEKELADTKAALAESQRLMQTTKDSSIGTESRQVKEPGP